MRSTSRAAALIADAGGDETGVQAIGGEPRAMQAAGEFAGEKNVAKLGAAIGFHGSKTFGHLQIVEIESGSLMRGRSCADDARRRRRQEPFAQPLGDNKIRHVIQREGIFQPVLGELAVGEHCPRVIDQDVDARLLAGDFGGHTLHFRDAGQIGVMNRVGEVWCFCAKPREAHLSA
jgi:hypothetical protein